MKKGSLNYIDLFAGAGGLSEALQDFYNNILLNECEAKQQYKEAWKHS